MNNPTKYAPYPPGYTADELHAIADGSASDCYDNGHYRLGGKDTIGNSDERVKILQRFWGKGGIGLRDRALAAIQDS
jgi:hypothetical protein